jgi:succinate dehydrogenase / fumarate reductase cytochrome b subunit
MRWSGVILIVFVIYHLLHFTVGSAHPDFIPGDVYHNFVEGFRSVPVSLFYIFAMVLLGLHLRHGVWSMFQTLGVSHPRYMRWAHVAAWIFAAIVAIGNVSFPLAVLAGIVK